MARNYKRDSNGRFSSTGGGKAKGGGAKSAPKTTSARGRALANERKATKAVKAANKSGAVGRKEAKSQLVAQRAREFYQRSGTGTKRSKSSGSGVSKAAANLNSKGTAKSSKPAKMSKAPTNAAKQAYKSARSEVRELKMYRAGKTDKVVKAAEAKVKRLEKSRGLSKTRKSRK